MLTRCVLLASCFCMDAAHAVDFTRWWCDKAEHRGNSTEMAITDPSTFADCAGMEFAYDRERSPSKWVTLEPAYFVSAIPWFFGKLQRILVPDAVRAAVPILVIFFMLFHQTKDVVLAISGVLVILFAIVLSLIFFRVIVGGTWLSVYALPALYVTVGVGGSAEARSSNYDPFVPPFSTFMNLD